MPATAAKITTIDGNGADETAKARLAVLGPPEMDRGVGQAELHEADGLGGGER